MDESQTQNRSFLAGKLVSELQAIAEQVGVKDPKKRKKAELIDAILGIAPQPSSLPCRLACRQRRSRGHRQWCPPRRGGPRER